MNTDRRPHRPRLRRLPRRARGARRGLDRGREDADLPGLRTRPGRRLRPPPRGDRLTARVDDASGDAGRAGLHGRAVALGVAGDPADGHVDAEAGGGALLFGLATPEAVLAVLACPLAARRRARRSCCRRRGPWPRGRRGSRAARRPGRRTGRSGLGTPPSPVQVSGPVKIRFETVSTATDTMRRPPVSARKCGRSGSRWGEPAPRVVLRHHVARST